MAIGKRIVERLEVLGWDRRELLARVPGLTPQSLSNLIRRDSARSEWDVLIADALSMTVTELVYGESAYPPPGAATVFHAGEPESPPAALAELLKIASALNERAIWELIGQARLLAQIHPAKKRKRA